MKTTKKKESNHTLRIGMRIGKSLIAIVMGFLIWQGLRVFFPDLEIHPVFIYMYSFLEIRDTSEKTKVFGIQRIKSTLIAMAIGLPMLVLRVYVHTHLADTVLVTAIDLAMILLGTLLTLWLGNKTGCGSMTGVAAAIFIILLIYHANEDRYIYSVLRASQTIIGVAVAWLVNVVLFPYPGRKKESKE